MGAVFHSLFPDFSRDGEKDSSDESMWEIWLLLGLIFVIIVGVGIFMYYISNQGPTKKAAKVAANATAAVATSAAQAAASAVNGMPAAKEAVAAAVESVGNVIESVAAS